MSLVTDVVDSAILTVDRDGFHSTRVFVIDGGIASSKESRLYQALLTSGIPSHGDPHPVIPNIFARDIRAEPIKNGEQVKVLVNYEPLDEDEGGSDDSEGGATGAVTITAGTLSENTFFDINGTLLSVEYQGIPSIGSGFIVTTQVRQAEVQHPQISVSLKRTETEVPKTNIETYVGTVNSVEWSGFPEKTWLCTAVNVSQNKDEYEVEYQFAYRKQTWRAEVSINVDNKIPIDVQLGNGLEFYDVYESTNFNNIGVSF